MQIKFPVGLLPAPSQPGLTCSKQFETDDTVLLAKTENDLQEIQNYVNNTGKLYGTKTNANKTKTMVVTRKEETPEINIEIDGCQIDQNT